MPAEPYLRNVNEQIVLTQWTNRDGITFEPFIDGHTLGYRITEVETGRVEYVLLAPTDSHDVNPENGATADTFVYALDRFQAQEYEDFMDREGHPEVAEITDFGSPVVYVNHFENL